MTLADLVFMKNFPVSPQPNYMHCQQIHAPLTYWSLHWNQLSVPESGYSTTLPCEFNVSMECRHMQGQVAPIFYNCKLRARHYILVSFQT